MSDKIDIPWGRRPEPVPEPERPSRGGPRLPMPLTPLERLASDRARQLHRPAFLDEEPKVD